MTETHGWERPLHFSGAETPEALCYRRNDDFAQILKESAAVEHEAGLIDLSSFTSFIVSGKDSAAFLDSLTPARLPRLNRAVLCHVLNDNGTFLAEWTMVRLDEDEFAIFSGAAAETTDMHLLELAQAKFSGSVTIENATERSAALLLTGPKSRDILTQCSDADLSTSALPWMGTQDITIAGCPVLLVRMSYAGALGYEIHTDPEHLVEIHNALKEAAGSRLCYVGTKTLNGLRMEKAFPAYGSELTNEVTFIEAGMTRFWDRKKSDFRGKVALEAAENSPKKQMLVYLELDKAATERLGVDSMGNEPIYAGKTLVGMTTSGGYGARVQKSLAFGYITPEATDRPLHALIQGEMIPITLLDQAAFDPDYSIIRK